jgi:release factor glutamine methyltransferase
MIAINKVSHRENALKDVLTQATLQLEGGAVLRPQAEAERILEDATGLSRAELYLNGERRVSLPEREFVENALGRRLTGKPLQYVLGHQQFRYLDIACREGVLIPRPETELLVEAALTELKRRGGLRTVVDIGSGTGAIAISIAHEYEKATVYTADISEQALTLTKENARSSGVSDRVHAINSDLFSGLGELTGRLDMVVSNPPYIPSGELATLQREVQFEPRTALDGGNDGLDFYRKIIRHSPEFLKSGGALLLEIGIDQASYVVALLKEAGCFTDIEVRKDYQDIDRIVFARKA